MRCEKKNVKIPKEFLNTLKPLYKHPTEVGGGINFDEKGKVKTVHYFASDSNKKIQFTEIYDVEFHAHPPLGKTKRHLVASRRCSASDIASTFVSGREEIIFSKGYAFIVHIKDRALFEKTKIDINKRFRGQKFESPYHKYKAFFVEQESVIMSKYANDIKMLNDEWNKELKKYGLEVGRVNPNKIELTVHGKCKG